MTGFAMSFPNAMWLLILIRAFLGVSVGVVTFASPLYIGELASAKRRGLLISSFQLSLTVCAHAVQPFARKQATVLMQPFLLGYLEPGRNEQAHAQSVFVPLFERQPRRSTCTRSRARALHAQ